MSPRFTFFSIAKKLCGMVAAGTLLLVPAAWAATEIRTAAQLASEPKFLALGEDSRTAIGGICIDIMRAIESVDASLKFVGDQAWQPLARIEAGMANGDLDVSCGLLRTAAREARYTYIDTPLFPVSYHLIVRADDDVKINNWNDVRKLGDNGIILVINGFGILSKLEELPGLKIDSRAYTSKGNFDKLLAGRGRFYYHRSPGIHAEIRNAGIEGKVRILQPPMYKEKFYMAASKRLAPETIGRLSKALGLLEHNGQLAKLLKKWDE